MDWDSHNACVLVPPQVRDSPHLTSPHLTSPHLTSPHLTSPHLTSPHLTSPHRTAPHRTHRTSPHLTCTPPYLTSPHLTPRPHIHSVTKHTAQTCTRGPTKRTSLSLPFSIRKSSNCMECGTGARHGELQLPHKREIIGRARVQRVPSLCKERPDEDILTRQDNRLECSHLVFCGVHVYHKP